MCNTYSAEHEDKEKPALCVVNCCVFVFSDTAYTHALLCQLDRQLKTVEHCQRETVKTSYRQLHTTGGHAE
jgi:hypothetical protein